MITKEQTNNYFGASSITSDLKNQIIDSVWAVLGIDLAEKLRNGGQEDSYYEFNRRICATLDSFIGVLSVEQVTETRIYKPEMKEYIINKMGNILASEIIKSDFIVMKESGGDKAYWPTISHSIEVPFLKLQRGMLNPNKNEAR